MKYILSLFIALWSIAAWGQEGGDGFNPSNPGEPGQRYNLTVNVTPDEAGSTSPSGKQQYALGESVYLSANANNYYQFVGWIQDGDTISRNRSFNYTMPAKNTAITAVFKATDSFNPDNPDDPSQEVIKYKLVLTASPAEGGSFNITSGERFSEGASISVYAYPNSNYQFEGWKQGDKLLSTEGVYSFVMGKEDVSITGLFHFNPANPGNPGANHWDAETGELIIDDFTPGSIMNAVDQVTGGSNNYGKVSMVIISGQMNSHDFGIVDRLNNCTLIDLSRTGGYTEIPPYAFDNTNLSTAILPACTEKIGYHAFGNCKNLTDISCYAITPPIADERAFEGIAENAVIRVLSSSIPLYAEAAVWKDFTILPLTEDVRTLEVNLPVGSESTYKNMTIELQNLQNGQKQRYVVSDRITYTFNGLLKNCTYNVYLKTPADVVLGQIEKIEIKEENQSVTFSSLLTLLDVNLKVQTPDGTDVTDQTQVTWLNDQQTYLSQGSSLKAQTAGTKLNYRIVLNQNLGMQYVTPENQTYSVKEEENQLVYTLIPIEMLTVSGLVKNANSDALSGAVISISQKLNGKYSKSFITQTDTKGKFELDVFNDESTISVSATDYISQTLTKANFNAGADLGTVELKAISGTTINLNLTYTPSVATDEEARTENWYSDYANIAYTIYNETQEKEITNFSVQYPSIVLLEEVAAGDRLRIIASSKNGAFRSVTATATVDENAEKANVLLNIIALGGISASYTDTDNTDIVGILYDSKGELLKKYTYFNQCLSISNLSDGKYTLVSMVNSAFFNSILKISQLAASGLTEGTDYVQNTVTVKSGILSSITNSHIPMLDESKLYYTGDNTSFTANKASIVAGNYLTLKGKIDFKEEYTASVSNVQLIVDLPETSLYVENSAMTGSNIASYTLDNNRLTIPLHNYTELVRFCVIPTASGEYIPNAFVQFTLNGKEILQPIGAATCTIKDLSISIPSTVAKKTFSINGTAIGKSEVEIYDNGILIGQTTSLANGLWYTTCELYNAKNLSSHDIYAKIRTKDGAELQTETCPVLYNENAIEVSKVTMINIAHGASSLDLLEYVTTFDFINPITSAQTYWYWPNYPDFTFKIDFTNNSPEIITNVALHVKTSSNNIVRIPASYNQTKDIWVATHPFQSEALPVNLSVTYDYIDYSMCDSLAYINTLEKNIGIPVIEDYDDTDDIFTYSMKSKSSDIALKCFFIKTDIKNKEAITKKIANSTFKLCIEKGPFKYYVNDTDAYQITRETSDSLFVYAYFGYDDVQSYKDYVTLFGKNINTTTRIAGFDPGSDRIAPSTDRLNQWRDHIIQGAIDEANRKLKCADDITNINLHSDIMHLRQCVGFSLGSFLAHSANLISSSSGRPENVIDAGNTLWDAADAASSFGDGMQDLTRAGHAYLQRIHDAPDCPDDNGGKGSDSGESGNPNPNYVMDPSGYVYEAVASNRLQGVTATCYYKEMVEDMYGDLHENIVLWDAAEYAQENPLFTDENGMYAWDVPQGLWQVKFEKEGYQTTYSEWLPVPPPQLEVNIGMVQTAQPTVTAIRGYETGIEIDFSKFMLPETMTAEFITITRNGEAVAGEVTFKNAEANPQNKNEQFVSKVRFVPAEALATTDKVILTVSKRVKSYAGIQMESDYSQEIAIEKEPKAVVASEIEVVYNETAEITVTVEPAEASTGKKVTATSVSSIIATIEPAEATLNEEGKATFIISGELPGQTMIQFAVEGMDMKPEVKVSVVEAGEKEITRNYTLSMGWNWFSINVQDQNLNDIPALLAPIKESVLILKGQNGELTNKNENDWEGSLNSLNTTQAYKIKMKKEATLELTGKGADPTSNTITLNQGWNWIGYIPTVTLPLEQALQNLQAEENDLIKGLDSFAIYDGSTWTGSLTHLLPGEGYMYYSQSVKSFNYTANGTESEPSTPSAQWSYDIHQSEDNVIAIAELYNGEQKAEIGKFLVGVFVGDECRGIAVEKDGYLFITAHGEQTDGKLTLRAFDTADQQEYNVKEEIEWSGTLTGSLTTPVSLHIGEATGITPISEGLLVYPSPVRHRLYIRGEIGNIEEVRISDTAGQTLILDKQVIPNEGINVSSLSKGIYFIIIKTDNEVIQQKFMKID